MNRFTSRLLLFSFGASFIFSGCSTPNQMTNGGIEVTGDQQTAFRVRSEMSAGLNADQGWAGALNENVTVSTDEPFRIRFEVESSAGATDQRRYRLQYRRNGGAWMNVEPANFPYPDEETPRISVIATDAFENGSETTDLLAGSNAAFSAGAGVSLDDISPAWSGESAHSEWEWPLVIRRFADGAVTNDEGDTFEFRMADAGGCPLASSNNPLLTVSVPPGHLGGTFVETPGRIGPWEASNGDLYFLMEPSETFNVLMTVKSTDGGETWQEIDEGNRPVADDLEGFATDLFDGTIYMLHQTSDDVWLHSFRTSDHPTQPDTWAVRDELVTSPEEPPTQVATTTVRSDGSIVAVYGGPEKIHYKIRSTQGSWGEETVIDADVPPGLSGPMTVLGADDVVHLAYTGSDGTAWYRRIQPDGTLTPREQLATGIGTTEGDVGSILPLVFIPETNTAVVIYRLATGKLWERRIIDHGAPTDPVQVSERDVVQNAVDADQTGADAIAAGTSVHVLFIEEGSGSIYHTHRDEAGVWQPATLQVDGIRGQWIRGTRLTQGDGATVYGYVYDAGSNGGSGFNRFAEMPLDGR
jgi:hypothetical protein